MSSLFLGADKQSRSLWMRQLRKCRSALSTGHPSIQFIHVGYNGSVNCVLVFPTRANGHSKHMKAQLDTFTLEPNSCACSCLIYKVHIWHTHDKYFLLIHIFKTPPPPISWIFDSSTKFKHAMGRWRFLQRLERVNAAWQHCRRRLISCDSKLKRSAIHWN